MFVKKFLRLNKILSTFYDIFCRSYASLLLRDLSIGSLKIWFFFMLMWNYHFNGNAKNFFFSKNSCLNFAFQPTGLRGLLDHRHSKLWWVNFLKIQIFFELLFFRIQRKKHLPRLNLRYWWCTFFKIIKPVIKMNFKY